MENLWLYGFSKFASQRFAGHNDDHNGRLILLQKQGHEANEGSLKDEGDKWSVQIMTWAQVTPCKLFPPK